MFRLDTDPALLLKTEEQRRLRAVPRDFLAGACGPEEVAGGRPVRAGSTRCGGELAGETGMHGLALPEEHGGAGYSFAEPAVALEENGLVSCPGPLLPTVLPAGHARLRSGDRAACARRLPAIAAGATTATAAGFCIPPPSLPGRRPTAGCGTARPASCPTAATPTSCW